MKNILFALFAISVVACKNDGNGNPGGDSDPVCTPDCTSRECGDDGCGGSCGVCQVGTSLVCSETSGRCVVQSSIPDGWTCDPTFYGGSDGCDCECGVRDLDCENPDATVVNCDHLVTAICNADGLCEAVCTCDNIECGDDGCGTNCGTCIVADTFCDAGSCEPCSCDGRECGDNGCGTSCGTCTTGECMEGNCVDVSWTCDPEWYGGSDGCDCGCGVRDLDCDDPSQRVFDWCDDVAQISGCDESGKCIGGVPLPDEWACEPHLYGDGIGCDCSICGVYDIDCDNPETWVYGCPGGSFVCNASNECEPA